MKLLLGILKLPFLPISLAWKWTSGAAINGSANGCAHLIGFLIIAGMIYSGIGYGIMALLRMCGVVK